MLLSPLQSSGVQALEEPTIELVLKSLWPSMAMVQYCQNDWLIYHTCHHMTVSQKWPSNYVNGANYIPMLFETKIVKYSLVGVWYQPKLNMVPFLIHSLMAVENCIVNNIIVCCSIYFNGMPNIIPVQTVQKTWDACTKEDALGSVQNALHLEAQ